MPEANEIQNYELFPAWRLTTETMTRTFPKIAGNLNKISNILIFEEVISNILYK